MRKVQLAGRDVSCLALGCMSFAGFYGATTEEASQDCLQSAVDLGVDHWDVAEIYGMGHAETMIGQFLRNTPVDVSIATKAGIYVEPERHFSNAPETLRASLEGSLKRLGRDHVELFYIHRREQNRPIEEVMEFLVSLIEEGLIGSIGLSEVAPSTLRRAARVHPVAAVQSEYSLWTRLPELGMLQACKELGTTFVAFSPVGRGIFADQVPDITQMTRGDFRLGTPRFQEPHWSANVELVAPFQDYCASKGWNTSAAAVAWTLHQGDHVLPIPGTRTAAHLKELAQATQIAFSPDELKEIERMLPLGFAHGDRYADARIVGAELYC